MRRNGKWTSRVSELIAVFGVIVLISLATSAQSESVASNMETQASQKLVTPTLTPAIKDLEGVRLGMTEDEVKELLGKPKVGDPEGGYYILSKHQSMKIRFDSDGKVIMAALIYMGGGEAPKFYEVFGSDAMYTGDASGRVYKMVRYPDAGYWVAYSQLQLDDGPMTTITMQKMG